MNEVTKVRVLKDTVMKVAFCTFSTARKCLKLCAHKSNKRENSCLYAMQCMGQTRLRYVLHCPRENSLHRKVSWRSSLYLRLLQIGLLSFPTVSAAITFPSRENPPQLQ
jgi:hypothetical protein